jgi:very-short-patch-repair endonuclease
MDFQLSCDVERFCDDLAASHHGVVGRAQLISAGLSDDAIDRRVASGRLRRLLPETYAHAAAPASHDQAVMAACIWAGGHACRRTAAAKWKLAGFKDAKAIEVATSRPLSHPGIRVCRRAPLPQCDLSVVDSIPVTAPPRTLLDLGAVATERCVEIALDDALRRGLTSIPQLRWHLTAAGRRGVRGTAKLRAILESRRLDKGITESPLETISRRLFRNSGLPSPVKQFRVMEVGTFLGRVDFAYPEYKIAIEVHGWKWHSGRNQWERDVHRRTILESHGWMVLEFTWNEVANDPEHVIQTILAAVRSRSFLLRPRLARL